MRNIRKELIRSFLITQRIAPTPNVLAEAMARSRGSDSANKLIAALLAKELSHCREARDKELRRAEQKYKDDARWARAAYRAALALHIPEDYHQ